MHTGRPSLSSALASERPSVSCRRRAEVFNEAGAEGGSAGKPGLRCDVLDRQ